MRTLLLLVSFDNLSRIGKKPDVFSPCTERRFLVREPSYSTLRLTARNQVRFLFLSRVTAGIFRGIQSEPFFKIVPGYAVLVEKARHLSKKPGVFIS